MALPPPPLAKKKKPFNDKIQWSAILSCTDLDVNAIKVSLDGYPTSIIKQYNCYDLLALEFMKQLKRRIPRYFLMDEKHPQFQSLREKISVSLPEHKVAQSSPLVIFEDVPAPKSTTFDEMLCAYGNMFAFDILFNDEARFSLQNGTTNIKTPFSTAIKNPLQVSVKSMEPSIITQYIIEVEKFIKALIESPLSAENSFMSDIVESILLDADKEVLKEAEMYALRCGLLQGFIDIVQGINQQVLESLVGKISKLHKASTLEVDFMYEILELMVKYAQNIAVTLGENANSRVFLQYELSPHKLPQSAGHHAEYVKVTLIQDSSIHEDALERMLEAEDESQRTDIVLFHEYWFGTITFKVPIPEQEAVKPYIALANKYNVYICLGAGCESGSDGKQYCTSILLGPTGYIGYYRKQRPIIQGFSKGSRPGVWDTPLGRLGILICFDIENADVFEETMKLHPDILLNPVLISNRARGKAARSNWNIGMDEMSHKFEALSRKHNCAYIRCDAPYGLGSSQSISPMSTVTTPSKDTTSFSVFVPKVRPEKTSPLNSYTLQSTGSGFEDLCCKPERARTEYRDNTGNRYLVRTIQHPMPISEISLINHGDILVTTEKRGNNSQIRTFETHNVLPGKNISVDGKVSTVCGIDENLVAFSSGVDALLIDVTSGEIVNQWKVPSPPNAVTYHEGTLFYGTNSEIISYSCTGEKVNEFQCSHSSHFLRTNGHYLISGNHNGYVSLFDTRTSACLTESQVVEGNMIGIECWNTAFCVATENALLHKFSLDEFSQRKCSPIVCDLTTEQGLLTTMSSFESTNGSPWLLLGCENGQILLVSSSFTHFQQAIVSHRFYGHSAPIERLYCDGIKICSYSHKFSSIWHYRQNRHYKPWADAFLPQ